MITGRYLKLPEKTLLKAMLIEANVIDRYLPLLDTASVIEMSDGGMGSLKFIDKDINQTRFGRCLIAVQCKDIDEVVVIVSILLDKNDDLYELDVWKTDFKPLKKFPTDFQKVVP